MITQSWRCQVWKLRQVSSVILGGAVTLTGWLAIASIGGNSAIAQIVPDATLGTESSVVTSSDQIEGGAIRGVNLFHSFQEFNVSEGQQVYFNNPVEVENILSRVTGSNPSNILGILGVTGGNANLFLLNPNGIIFGPGARLDVDGSFLASTANSFTFPDGTQFSATNPEAPPLLTINVPIGLQYGSNAGNIQVQQGAILEVPSGETLALVGGNVSLTGASLLAQGGDLASTDRLTPGGRVELGGLAEAGTVVLNTDGTLSFPDGVARADVSLTNQAQVNVSAGNHGSIAVNARNFDISEGSRLIGGIRSDMGGNYAQAGDIEIKATGAVTLAGRDSTIRNSVNNRSIGNAGELRINAETLTITGGAQLDTTIYRDGQGKAGNITVDVDDSVTLEGVGGNNRPSRIHSEVMPGATGNAGDIIIDAKSVYVRNGGQLNVQTNGNGNPGNIKITATDEVKFEGALAQGNRIFTSIAESRVDENGIVNNASGEVAGEIHINARTVSLTDSGQLLSDTKGQGPSGNITIIASESLLVSGVSEFAPEDNSAIISSANGRGNGGNITIETGSLTVSDGGFIDANTNREGLAGNVTIFADSVTVEGVSSSGSHSRLVAQTDQASIDDGGNLEITTRQLTVRNEAEVNVSSTGLGDSGSLIIKADIILLENQGMLSASTASGEGGNISLQVHDYILMRGNSLISAEADNNGNGGNIMINAPFIVAVSKEDNDIIAHAFQGQGGNINLTAQGIYGLEYQPQLSSLSDINASSEFGVDGVVEFNTPDFDPTQGVAKLPDEPVNNPEVAQGCQGGGKQGTVAFFNPGRGGLAPNPHEALSASQLWEDVPQSAQGTEIPVAANIASTSPAAPPNEIVEAQGWITNEKGEVTLVAEVPATHSQRRCRLR